MSALDLTMKMVLSLIVTGAILFFAYIALKTLRNMQNRLTDNKKSQLLSFERSIPLGPKERLTIVRYGKEQLLLGVTAGGISLLKATQVVEDSEIGNGELTDESEAATLVATQNHFGSILKELTRKGGGATG